MYDLNDIFFLKNQFSKLTDSKNTISPVEYIEQVRYLPPELTPMPGKYSYSKAPFLREIVNHLSSESDARKVAFMKAAQIMATTGIIESGMAYNIGCDPKPQLFVSADKELVRVGMETKVERLLDSCGLREKIFSQTATKSKKTGDTVTSKEYPGGFLHAIGARNPGKLRQMSYPNIWFDELDGFPLKVGQEGSPIDLAEKRTKAYALTRKIFYMSTPTISQTSPIYYLYKLGDQRKWHVPCVHCGEMQVLVWHAVTDNGVVYGVKFRVEDSLPIYETVTYQCMYCHKHMKNHDKAVILDQGEWRPTAKSKEPGLYSYWANSLISPLGMYSWEDMVVEWAKCWDLDKNRVKDNEKLKTFYNTDRGLPFENRGESIRMEKVKANRSYHYLKNEINNLQFKKDSESEILLLTCAVDVQKNNLFVDVKGWTVGGRSYTIDFFSIDGPVEDFNSSVWKELDDILTQKIWIDERNRQYRIINTVIDSGKYTQYVYEFCKSYSAGVYSIKGNDYIVGGLTYKEFAKTTLEKAGLPVAYHVNTTKIKDRISKIFNLQWDTGQFQPEWFANFPEDMRDDYFRMFEAESRVDEYDKVTNKFLRTRWRLTPGAENHAFDTFCYNIACLEIIADYACRNELGMQYLDWNEFWMFCQRGDYYN